MDPLYQRLKELDSIRFELLCFHLLKQRHPEADLRHADGSGGDEGVDIFCGELSDGPAIWQCKSFPNGVGKSQKEQIRQSLKRAIAQFRPRRWILCLSVDMDSKTQRWFQRLRDSYRAEVDVGLLDASNIVHELIHRRSLRNHFFPESGIDIIELKRVINRTGELSSAELERITENNLEDYIERLKERDGRFNYEVLFSDDLGPRKTVPEVRPGLVMSVRESKKTINVYARDLAALRSSPPKIYVALQESGLAKISEFRKTGKPQKLLDKDFFALRTDLPLLKDLELRDGYSLSLEPTAELGARRLRTRITFGTRTESVRFGYVELRPKRAGTDELELVAEDATLPFSLSVVVLPRARQLSMSWEGLFEGRDVRDVWKFIRAVDLVRCGGEIDIVDLVTERSIARGTGALPGISNEGQEMRSLIDELVQVSERFHTRITFPNEFRQEDFETLSLLRTYMSGSCLALDDISVVISKLTSDKDVLLTLENGGRLALESARHLPPPRLFGQEIDTGPCVLIAEHVRVNDLQETMRALDQAKDGTGVKISFKPLKPVRFALLPERSNAEEYFGMTTPTTT